MSATETGTSLVQRTQQVVAQIQHPDYLEQLRESLPEGVTLDRFKRVTITAVRSNPDLVNADQDTLFGAIVKCAQDGLLPDGREAALVIYGGKVQYLPMIGGYRKIAADHGWTLQTQTVRVGDEFDFEEGLEPRLVHRRAAPASRGELENAYAIAQHRDGRKLFVVLDQAEVAKCRDVSKAKDKSGAPWTTWTERMWEKTAGKRLFKQLPLADLDQERLDRMMAAERAFETAADDPTTALYGPQDSPEAGGTGTDGDRQQAAVAATPPAAAAVPGEEAEEADWSAIDNADGAEPSDEAVAAAGAVTVPGGVHQGKPISELAGTPEGQQWMLTGLKRLVAEDPTRRAIETYVRASLPEVLAKYETWKAEQS